MIQTEKSIEIGGEEKYSIKVKQGYIDDEEIIVQKVRVKIDDKSFVMDLDEERNWEEVPEIVSQLLALEEIKRKTHTRELVSDDGELGATVGSDTKLFDCLLATALHQPCSSSLLKEVIPVDNVGSAIGNATYRGYMEAVYRKGKEHSYVLTPAGWKEVIIHLGYDDWEYVSKQQYGGFGESDVDGSEVEVPTPADGDITQWDSNNDEETAED